MIVNDDDVLLQNRIDNNNRKFIHIDPSQMYISIIVDEGSPVINII